MALDKLAAIRTFIAIVDCGSQTEAARRLGKSLPAVVRKLAELERDLAVKLLIRTTRHSHLTPEGELYYRECKKALSAIDASENRAREYRNMPLGRVRITAPVEFGNRFAAPVAFALIKKFPRLELQIQLTDRPVELVADEIDIAIRIGDLADSSLKARRVGLMPSLVCASKALLKKVGRPEHPDELAELPCIGVDIPGRRSGLKWRFHEEDGTELPVWIHPVLTCDNVRLAKSACVEGIGFGAFFAYQVADELLEGTLVQILVDYLPPARPVQLLWPPEEPMPRRRREVILAFSHELRRQLLDLESRLGAAAFRPFRVTPD